jgi:hypothetical protein
MPAPDSVSDMAAQDAITVVAMVAVDVRYHMRLVSPCIRFIGNIMTRASQVHCLPLTVVMSPRNTSETVLLEQDAQCNSERTPAIGVDTFGPC